MVDAPHTGAGIETIYRARAGWASKMRPVQGRELQQTKKALTVSSVGAFQLCLGWNDISFQDFKKTVDIGQ